MDIFNETKNKVYDLILEVINSNEITAKSIRSLFQEYFPSWNMEDEISSLLNSKNGTREKRNYNLLKKTGKGEQFRSVINSSISIRPTTLELQWLKFILLDEKADMFLRQSLKEKLLQHLEEVSYDSYKAISQHSKSQQEKTMDGTLSENIKLVIDIINNKKAMTYSYISNNGIEFKNKESIPYRIEFSVKHDEFYIIHYCLEEKRFIKSKSQGFKAIKKIDVPEIDLKSQYDKWIEEKKAKEPIVLQIKDEKNSLERAAYTFSPFHKEVKYLEEKDIYEMEIFYYSFEYTDILSRILSLGKYVVVKQPEHIRKEVISKIVSALGRYESL